MRLVKLTAGIPRSIASPYDCSASSTSTPPRGTPSGPTTCPRNSNRGTNSGSSGCPNPVPAATTTNHTHHPARMV